MAFLLTGCTIPEQWQDTNGFVPKETVTASVAQEETGASENAVPDEGGAYYDVTNVVLYLDAYGKLPQNYITKDEARALGWEGGSVEDFKEGAAIGGDRFGNREGLLPKNGGPYKECDIDTNGKKPRGQKRLIYSEDGRYYYTEDHYGSFRQVLIDEDHSVSFGEIQ